MNTNLDRHGSAGRGLARQGKGVNDGSNPTRTGLHEVLLSLLTDGAEA
jgi:hypothetical protein